MWFWSDYKDSALLGLLIKDFFRSCENWACSNGCIFYLFSDVFYDFRHKVCSYVSDLQLHLIQCSHSRKPAWAQNDAMMEAYLDNIDYYYRVCAYFLSKYKSDSLVYSPPVYLNHDF